MQQDGWETGSRSLTAGDAGRVGNADQAASFPQSASLVVSAQQAMPEAQHPPPEVGAPSQGSLYCEVPQKDADSCSQLSTDSAFPASALKPAAKQPTDLRKPRGRSNGGERCDACEMSPVPAFLSAMPPGMPMPPSGNSSQPQAQQQPQLQTQRAQLQAQRPQLQAGLQPQSQSQLQERPQAQLQPQTHPQLQSSGSMTSHGLADTWDAGSDSVSAASQHGSHQQSAEPQQERHRTSQQLTSWLPEQHIAKPDKQQLRTSKHATHVPWSPPAASSQEQPSSNKHTMSLPDNPMQAWPERQLNQEPKNRNMHAYEQVHDVTKKQQQVSTEPPVRLPETQQAETSVAKQQQVYTEPPVGLPGMQQGETSPKQQADGWDDSIADPPFNVIMQAPPLQGMDCRTSKSAKRSRASAPHYSSAKTAWDSKPREHQTDLLISQRHHDEKSAAFMPAGSQSVSASTGAIIAGHSALPKGIIQPGLGATPPCAPPVHFKSNQRNAEAQSMAASAFLPNSLQPGRGPSNLPDPPMHPRDIQPDMEPWRAPAVTLPPKSYQPHLAFSLPLESPMVPNGLQLNKGLLSTVARSLQPPGSLFQLDPVLPASKLDSIQPQQTPLTAYQAQIQPLPMTNISQSLAQEQYQLLSAKLGPLSVCNDPMVPPPVQAPAEAPPRPDSPQPVTHLGTGWPPAAARAARPQLTQNGGQPWGEANFAQDMLYGVHKDNKPADLSPHQASLASAGLERAVPPTDMQGPSAASGKFVTQLDCMLLHLWP